MAFPRTIVRVALAAALAAPLAACSDGLGSGETAPVTVLLTDAPGDLRTAVVTIAEIYLQGDDGRVVLMDEPTTVNLLELADATVTLVADRPVPAGSYAQLRFVITGGYIEVETDDGGAAFYASSADYEALPEGVTPGELQMPSYDASGLKVIFDGGALELTEESALLVDFDVHESFGRDAGDRWVLSPVLKGARLDPAEAPPAAN